jgi:hypothetical protein
MSQSEATKKVDLRQTRFAKRKSHTPLWVRSLLLGFVLSWVVALVHWVHVDLRIVRHPSWQPGVVFVDQVSGIDIVSDGFALLGVPNTGDWCARSYGWPLRNWCAVVRMQRQPRTAFQSVVPVFAIDLSGFFSRSPTCDMFFGQMPLFPGWGESLVNSFFWGSICFVVLRLRARSHQTEEARSPCQGCGYELADSGNAPSCPECGLKIKT